MKRTVMEVMSGDADTDALCTAEERASLADYVQRYGAADFVSAGILARFPDVYATAIASAARTRAAQ